MMMIMMIHNDDNVRPSESKMPMTTVITTLLRQVLPISGV